jgi:hypothetical protein
MRSFKCVGNATNIRLIAISQMMYTTTHMFKWSLEYGVSGPQRLGTELLSTITHLGRRNSMMRLTKHLTPNEAAAPTKQQFNLPSSLTTSLPRAIQIYTMAPPSQPTPPAYFPRRYSDPISPSKKMVKKPQRNVVQLLCERGYETQDFNGRGLKEFLSWCQCKDPAEDFDVICEQLQTEKLGLHLLGDIEFSILTLCGVKLGTAVRIISSFDEWLESTTPSIYY